MILYKSLYYLSIFKGLGAYDKINEIGVELILLFVYFQFKFKLCDLFTIIYNTVLINKLF